jgi:hypothetical protein
MAAVGDQLRDARVGVVYLAHGTFAGHDAFGLIAELGRVFPTASDAMRRVIKQLIDAAAHDVGNYTGAYAKVFEEAINREGAEHIPVRRFLWSSENHHIGRADGAVRLLDTIASLELLPGQRVLLWGHSHAGNVFALCSNLLSGNQEAIEHFFEATSVYYRWPLLGCVDIPVWKHVREMLLADRFPRERPLDLVTFGTPVRYGWDDRGYARLLHFINHKPVSGLPEYQAPFPPKMENVMQAIDGDYVQQFGIAGTNFMPSLLQWRAWWADNRLNRLLQPPQETRDLLERFRVGKRVPEAGTTLLVDYGKPDGTVAQHFAGHAVYTRREWLLFHAEEVARRLYGEGE